MKNSKAGAEPATGNHYEDFFGPFYFEPYAVEIAARIEDTAVSIALEIGAGTGRVTKHLRERIPQSATLIASDIDAQMLSVAKHKLSKQNIDWQIIDAQRLPMADNSIDLVVCSFGYMFVTDKQKAFAEAYRVLRPGGLLIFTTWDKLENNGASYLPRSIAESYLDAPIAESYNTATSMSDESSIVALIKAAGFSKYSVETLARPAICNSAKEAAIGLIQGGIYDEIEHKKPGALAEIRVKVEKALAEKFGAAPMIACSSALLTQASK